MHTIMTDENDDAPDELPGDREMTDEEYIRAGVELAEGWAWLQDEPDDPVQIQTTNPQGDGIVEWIWFGDCWKDALAAQLVRQVDESGRAGFYSVPGAAEAQWEYENSDELNTSLAEGPDRSMNAIRSIVDSGLLSPAQGERDG